MGKEMACRSTQDLHSCLYGHQHTTCGAIFDMCPRKTEPLVPPRSQWHRLFHRNIWDKPLSLPVPRPLLPPQLPWYNSRLPCLVYYSSVFPWWNIIGLFTGSGKFVHRDTSSSQEDIVNCKFTKNPLLVQFFLLTISCLLVNWWIVMLRNFTMSWESFIYIRLWYYSI